jgi:hypothetical protein
MIVVSDYYNVRKRISNPESVKMWRMLASHGHCKILKEVKDGE